MSATRSFRAAHRLYDARYTETWSDIAERLTGCICRAKSIRARARLDAMRRVCEFEAREARS